MKLTQLHEMATTSGGIGFAPVTNFFGDSDGYKLSSQLKKAKKKKEKAKKGHSVMDSNSFSLNESDYSMESQDAATQVADLKEQGLTNDEIIRKLIQNFDLTVIKDVLK